MAKYNAVRIFLCSFGLCFPALSRADNPVAAPPFPDASAYFVSVDGDDAGDGSAAKPFATLSRATKAMTAGRIKTTYVENGTYQLSSTLILKDTDRGETIANYPGHTPILSGATANLASIMVLQGSARITITGLTFTNARDEGALLLTDGHNNTITGNHFVGNGNSIVLTSGSQGNIISGNEIDNSAKSAIEAKDGSDANIFDSNLINGTGAAGTSGGGFFLHGVNNNVISHNLVEDTAGIGIAIENWDLQTVNIGNTIEYNHVHRANTSSSSDDSGAIYVLGRSETETGTVIKGNLVSGTGLGHPAHTVGIYLDDLSSGVTVTENILTGIGSDAIQIHGGRNNSIINNIIDTGGGRASAVLFQAAPEDTHPHSAMTNNVVSRNIIYSSSANPVIFVRYDGGIPAIFGNLYYNTAGVPMTAAGPDGDRQPKFGDPDFVDADGGDFTTGVESAVSTIGFQVINQRQIGLAPTTRHWY